MEKKYTEYKFLKRNRDRKLTEGMYKKIKMLNPGKNKFSEKNY